jgi:hypothetical protein
MHLEVVFVGLFLFGLIIIARALSLPGCLRAVVWTSIGTAIGWALLLYFVAGWFHH